MHDVFTELSLVIVITTAVSLFMRFIKQPLILGYILAGLLVGPSILGIITSTETFEVFSTLGIALLLFIIGLGMNVSELKRMGRVATTIACSTLVLVGSAGYIIGSLFGFTRTESIIVGLALFFSSTIIIVKILSDKKEQNRLHAHIAIGVILLDDIVATFALLFVVAAGKGDGLDLAEISRLLAGGLALLVGLVVANLKILPKISRFMAVSQELLFLFAIAWGFGVAALFEAIGFSIEIGALFAGVALAGSPYAQEIGSRLKPLRDFFVVLFFITLGESLNISNLAAGIWPAVLLSAVVIVLKPLIVITGAGLLGYAKRVSFKAGINLSQISEFSIILVVLATSAGLIREEISAIITLVAITTIAVSTYLMHYDEKLFSYFDKIKLKVFEKEVAHKEKHGHNGYPLLLFGYHHGGHEFIKTFKNIGKRYLVIDYDPSVIETLERTHVPHMYGDATDNEMLEEIGLDNTKLVISTFSDFEVSKQLVHNVSRINPKAVIISHASNHDEALKLYELGSTYVMIPHHIGSEKISSFIKKSGLKKTEFDNFRDKHLEYLRSRYEIISSAK